MALMVLGVLMLALLIGGLYGYFDDTETSTGNVFTAGTLNLVAVTDGTASCNFTETAGGDGLNGNVVFANIAPGDNGTITWTLTNQGTVDGDLTLVCTDNFSENGSNEPELAMGVLNNIGGNGDLDENLYCRLSCGGTYITAGGASTYVPFSAVAAALNSQVNVTLDAGQTSVYLLEWQVDGPTVGNEIQSDTATIDITFTLTQV